MPATRRSAKAAASGKQSTLSFNHRVTKAGPNNKNSKAIGADKASSAVQSPLGKHVASIINDDDDQDVGKNKKKVEVEEDKVNEIKAKEELEEEKEEEEVEETSIVEDVQQQQQQQQQQETTEVEARAAKITDRQVDQYWREVESERIAKRVHQGDLDVAEKVLRYFDVSSQYGPCIGITRLKRWQRAEKLGLNPPIEVLAVLLKEEQKQKQQQNKKQTKAGGKIGSNNGGISMRRFETAHMDDILNSTAVGAS